jgi:hypothetical protein
LGSFYGNVTLLGATFEAACDVAPRPAFAFADAGAVVLFAEVDDQPVPRSGAGLTESLGCMAFSVGIYDDDIFFFEVHDRGRSVLAGAFPDPAKYFALGDEMLDQLDLGALEGAGTPPVFMAPASPDPAQLVTTIGRGEEASLRAALGDGFTFATERHRAVVVALGLPAGAVGWGYRYLTYDSTAYSGPPLVRLERC